MQRFLLIAASLWCFASSAALHADTPRFSAMLAGGQRLEGTRFHDWHQNGAAPRLDNQELMNAGNPLAWICDRSLRPGPTPRAYLEMTTGDRLPCEIIAYESGDDSPYASLPAHFVVRPTINVSPPHSEPHAHVRIAARFVRRIVRPSRASSPAYQPGTLITRHGRVVKYRAARFVASELRLLTSDGQETFALGDIGQLHMPAVDPWEAYVDELAFISPRGEDRLLQFESTDGAILTASMARFQIVAHGDANICDNWWHALQPAWSLDTLWLQNTRIWARRSWAFDQVPLARLQPTSHVSKSLLGGGQRAWQANLNVEHRPLQANAQMHGWGFGVHAYSELHFALPDIATGFRTRLCLDDAVGAGGCVIARVFAGSVKNQPLYQSPHLIGSKSLQDTGVLNLANLDPQQRTLILQVDAAAQGRPQNADPFDIRDMFDWLDPVVVLDATKLREIIAQRIAPTLFALDDWQVLTHPEGRTSWFSVYEPFEHPRPAQYVSAVSVENQPLTLARDLKVESQHQWLLVSTYRQGGATGEPEITVRIDGVNILSAPVPQRNTPEVPRPLLVPLAPYLGHTIRLEVVAAPPANAGLPPVHWQTVKVIDQTPMLYRVLEDDEEFTPVMKDEKSLATFVEADKHVGRRSLELTPGGGHRTSFAQPIEVRSGPDAQQKRFLRFAFRKVGLGSVTLELEHRDSQTRPAIYSAGTTPPNEETAPKSTSVWSLELPDQWIVMTRDVYSDFGALDVTGVILRTPDGDRARFDHIYFARAAEDFQLLPQAPPPEIANRNARRDLARSVLDRGHPATVAIEIEDRLATGVLVGGDGLVLTAGHLLVAPGKTATVYLPDGHQLPAKTLGIFRSADLGLVQITDRQDAQLAGLDLHDQRDFTQTDLYVGLAYVPFVEETPGAAAHIVGLKQTQRETLWTDFLRDDVTPGGPLLGRDGRIIGTHIASSPFDGNFVYTKSYVARENWDRMKSGEIYGAWFPGTGPIFGVVINSAAEGAKIISIAPGTPAAAADVQANDLIERIDGQAVASLEDVYRLLAERDPGAEITLDLNRGGKKLPQKVKLVPRLP